MTLTKKTMEHPFPTPLYSRVPNEETTAWPEMKRVRGGNGNGTSCEVPKMSGTAQYAAETWCLKAKMVAKLNSTEMDYW